MQLFNNSQGDVVIQFVSEEQAAKLIDLQSNEERLIYKKITDSGSEGCLPSQLAKEINQTVPKVTAILKDMKKRGLIKTLRSVNRGNKAVWLLINVDPGQDVTGGLTGNEGFDHIRV